jgi:hypothetical protein
MKAEFRQAVDMLRQLAHEFVVVAVNPEWISDFRVEYYNRRLWLSEAIILDLSRKAVTHFLSDDYTGLDPVRYEDPEYAFGPPSLEGVTSQLSFVAHHSEYIVFVWALLKSERDEDKPQTLCCVYRGKRNQDAVDRYQAASALLSYTLRRTRNLRDRGAHKTTED